MPYPSSPDAPGSPARRPTLSLLLPKDAPAPRTARAALDRWLEGIDRQTADAARSIVTELVSDAVRFGRPPIRLKVMQHAVGLRIEVADAGAGTPSPRTPGISDGWGLDIVGKLAARHGSLPDASGLWCELGGAR